jgi:hypothetical protein
VVPWPSKRSGFRALCETVIGLRVRSPTEATLLRRRRCNAIASIAAKHFDGRFATNRRKFAQLPHLGMAILALPRVVDLIRHGPDDARETWLESLKTASVRLRSKSSSKRIRINSGGLYSCEGDANPLLFSPDDMTTLTSIACCEVDGDLVRNACRTWYVKRSSGRRHIADGAFNVLAVEFNRSGLEHTLANCRASVDHHRPDLSLEF